jgi:hypothetical protein
VAGRRDVVRDLGPLLVRDGDEEIAVPAAFPADELAELVWDGSPSATPS